MRLGLYGGSFNPVHYGHLLLAETACSCVGLDRVEFLPVGVPPHKKHFTTSGEARFQMLVAALAPYPEYVVSRYELDSTRTSYTADTLRYYHELYPNDELFLIVSSETFNEIPIWHTPKEVCRLASLVVACRAGYPPPNFELYKNLTDEERLEEMRRNVVSMPQMDLSSTAIRASVAAGRSIRFQTPDVVVDYIRKHNLYVD